MMKSLMAIQLHHPPIKRTSQLFGWLILLVFFCSCESRYERILRQADSEASQKHFRAALSDYESLLVHEPGESIALRAAREGARISYFEIKDYPRALTYYRHLVYHSNDSDESLAAQRQLVTIYAEHLADYEKAILETAKLIEIEKDPVFRVDDRIRIARAHYHLNRFSQAKFEIDEAFRLPQSDKKEFELKQLKANILTADKKFTDAVVLLKELMARWRERAIKENVPMTLAVCYEEMRDFKGAMAMMESVRAEYPVPEYIDLRIKRLNERMKNAPQVKGPRK